MEKSSKLQVKLIPVLPKNYRAIALEAIRVASKEKVIFNKKEIYDFTESGVLTQKELRNCKNFEIRDGDTPILGFHDHPSQMWISENYWVFAKVCEDAGWLKIEGQAS